MSKPGADPSSGISLGDALRLPKRHPAYRRREAQSGSGMERENLAGDAKVSLGVEFAADLEACFGRGCGNEFHDSRPARQRSATPILRDVAKQAVLNLVPL